MESFFKKLSLVLLGSFLRQFELEAERSEVKAT